MTSKAPEVRNLVENRRARHDYELTDHFEAGIALLGSEVKSLRAGNGNLREAFVQLRDDGAWLVGAHVAPYEQATHVQHEPLRRRQLLLHHAELAKLRKGVNEKGMTAVPVRLYIKGSRIKLELALGRGKKHHDKRAALAERDAKRDIQRAQRGER